MAWVNIAFDTNEGAQSQVQYGVSASLLDRLTTWTSAYTQQHSARLDNLNADTTYYLQVRARDAAGNVSAWSTTQTIVTPAAPTGAILFEEPFIAGNLPARGWYDGASGTGWQVNLDTTLGSNVLQTTWGASGSNPTGIAGPARRLLPSAVSQFYIELLFKVSSGWNFATTTHILKWFDAASDDYTAPGSANTRLEVFFVSPGYVNISVNGTTITAAANVQLVADQWYKLRLFVSNETSPTLNNGTLYATIGQYAAAPTVIYDNTNINYSATTITWEQLFFLPYGSGRTNADYMRVSSLRVHDAIPVEQTDTTPPVISNVGVINITQSRATINWITDEPATRRVEYGASTSYGSITDIQHNLLSSHSVLLTGLVAGTTYYFRAISQDIWGNIRLGTQHTFTTTPADTIAPIISGVTASGVTGTQATISWTTNEGATRQVEYGPGDYADVGFGGYAYSTPRVDEYILNHSVTITSNLVAGQQYSYRAISVDESGNSRTSSPFTFTTVAVDTTPPIISAVTIDQITSTGFRIRFNTNEIANYRVEYGQSTNYGQATLWSSQYLTSHVATISSLLSNTRYYIRINARDGAGNISQQLTYVDTLYVDTTPPVVTGITATASIDSFSVTFNTDEASTSYLRWGTTEGVDNTTTASLTPGLVHTHTVFSLDNATTYYYQVVATDTAGNITQSTVRSATTLSPDPEDLIFDNMHFTVRGSVEFSSTDNRPVALSNPQPVVNGTTATITWTTDRLASCYMMYGFTSNSLTTIVYPITNNTRSFSVTLENLHESKIYYAMVYGRGANNITVSSEILQWIIRPRCGVNYQYTGAYILEEARKRCGVAAIPGRTDNTELVDSLNDLQDMYLVPAMVSAVQNYLVTSVDFTITDTDEQAIDIPCRAVSSSTREVKAIRNGYEYDLSRSDLEYTSSVASYNFIGDKLYVYNTLGYSSVRIYYHLHPNQLTLTYSVISAITGNTLTLDQHTFSTLDTVDIISHQAPFNTTIMCGLITSITTTSITIDTTPTGVRIGDYVCSAGYTPVPQLPITSVRVLIQGAREKIWRNLGDNETADREFAVFQEYLNKYKDMLTIRGVGEQRKIGGGGIHAYTSRASRRGMH